MAGARARAEGDCDPRLPRRLRGLRAEAFSGGMSGMKMIVVFSIRDRLKYIGHLDLMRAMQRAAGSGTEEAPRRRASAASITPK